MPAILVNYTEIHHFQGHDPLRYGAMSAALVLIIVVALLCVALLALFGLLWAALHFGVGHDDDN